MHLKAEKTTIKRLFVAVYTLFILLASSAAIAQPETEFVAYHDSAFNIFVPDYLVPVNDLSDDAIFQFKNIFAETYTIIAEEEKINGDEGQLEDIQARFTANLNEKGGAIFKKESLMIDGSPALQSEVRFLIDGHAFDYLITFIDKPNKLYKIYSWTLSSQKEKYFKDFRICAASLRFTDTASSRAKR